MKGKQNRETKKESDCRRFLGEDHGEEGHSDEET